VAFAYPFRIFFLSAGALAVLVVPACDERAAGARRGARGGVPIATSAAESRPTVSRLAVQERTSARATTGLNGDLLHFRLVELPQAGPWRVRIQWGDGVVDTPTVSRPGDQTFLHVRPYPTSGRYTVVVTATNAAGRASAPESVTVAVP
jgi:hypothetical protein